MADNPSRLGLEGRVRALEKARVPQPVRLITSVDTPTLSRGEVVLVENPLTGAITLYARGVGAQRLVTGGGGGGGGDMTKSVYDTDNDGIVDNSERLGNVLAASYMTKATYDTDADGIVDNAEALGGFTATQFIRSDTADTFDAGVVTTHNGAILATANNASANIAARWFEVSDGSTGPGDGADFSGEWGGGPSNNVRRIANVFGALAFTKASGTDATGAQYTFDGAVSISVGGLGLFGDLTIADSTNGTKFGSSGAKWSFDGNTPSATATFTPGNTDNEIGGLAISAAYSQAEVQALRDKCEELADDVRSLVTALKTKGILK